MPKSRPDTLKKFERMVTALVPLIRALAAFVAALR